MKNIYTHLFLLYSLALIAQCDPVSTLNEDFSNFTIATSGAFPQKCWTASGLSVYTEERGEPLNKYVVSYNAMIQNSDAYVVTPELNAITNDYKLSFEVFKVSTTNGTFSPHYAAVTVGTSIGGGNTNGIIPSGFLPYGDPIIITPNHSTYSITINAPSNHKHIVFRLTTNATHMFLGIDNVKYQPTLGTKESNKYYFNIYQNPSKEKNLRISKNIDTNMNFTIYDINGIKVYNTTLSSDNEQNINLSTLPSGLYIAKVESEYFSDSKKIVIK